MDRAEVKEWLSKAEQDFDEAMFLSIILKAGIQLGL